MSTDINKNNIEKKIPTFYRVKQCTNVYEDGTADFKMDNDSVIKMKYLSIANTSFNSVFESIFTRSSIVHRRSITGMERLKHFLNGLLFPEFNKSENELKIRNITEVNGEIFKNYNKNNKGAIRFDVPCKCECWENK